jgi:hypothetical protein
MDEGQGSDQRRQEAERQIDRRVGGDSHVLGNPELGILMFSLDELQPLPAIRCHPSLQKVLAQPGTPAALGGHPTPDGCDGQRHRSRCQGHEQQGLVDQRRAVFAADRVEEAPVPLIQRILDQHLQQRDRQQEPGQHPCKAGIR